MSLMVPTKLPEGLVSLGVDDVSPGSDGGVSGLAWANAGVADADGDGVGTGGIVGEGTSTLVRTGVGPVCRTRIHRKSPSEPKITTEISITRRRARRVDPEDTRSHL